jgi:DNA-binding Xre family transcriptional regulator
MARLRVKEVAEEKGFNIASLSRRADVSIKTVRRLWRQPESVTTTDTLERIAIALGVTIPDLFEP